MYIRTRIRGSALASVLLLLAATPTPSSAQLHLLHVAPTRGEQVWRAACAACHGANGAGRTVEEVVFEEPLPSFRDCEFAPREPDADWFGIVHDGGPNRAFSDMMPAFGDALTDAEIQAALDHVRTFCSEDDWPRGELNLPLALRTEKAFPEDEAVLLADIAAEGSGEVMSEFVYEQRIGPLWQWELKLPWGWHEAEAGASEVGIGDVTLGLKRVLLHSLRAGSIVSLALEAKLPTGSERRGFGSGTTVFEPWLAYGQLLPAELFLQFQGGVEVPVDRDRNDDGFWRFVLGRTFTEGRFGRSWSPMVELIGKRELVSGAVTDWELLPEMQVTLSTRQHVRLGAGVAFPLNDADVRPTTVHLYLLWDWFDGGLTEGW